jgi:adenylosuccinate lyase
MTSSDVLDTGLALQMKASVALLRLELDKLAGALRLLAREHKGTVMIGRSHAIHGEPITFGFKVAGWLAEVLRNQERLERLETVVSVGQISGAMGTYANTDPQVEAITCELLGLQPDTASTQVIGRDRHAEYVQTLALVGVALERISTEIPQPAAHRCAGGGGKLRQGAEGQLRHAPQAQPDPQRTDQRPGPGAAQLHHCRPGKLRAVA